jgi:hypothetical protein
MKMKMKVYETEAKVKKECLEQLIKENAEQTKSILSNKEDKKVANKCLSKSVSLPKMRPSSRSKHPMKTVPKFIPSGELCPSVSMTKYLYEECLEAMMRSMSNMNGTRDVQEGIYL